MSTRRTPPGSGAGPKKDPGEGNPSTQILMVGEAQAKRHLIYLAASLLDRDGPRYQRVVRAIGSTYPAAELFDPGDRFASIAARQARWPSLVRELDRLIVVGDERDVIGVFDMIELQDAMAGGVVVDFWPRDGCPVPISHTYVTPFNDPTAGAAAHVVERRHVTPALESALNRMPVVTLDGFIELLRQHETGSSDQRPH